MKKSFIIAAVAIGTVVIVGGGIGAFLLLRDNSDGSNSNPGTETLDSDGSGDAADDADNVIFPELDIVITDHPTYVENDCQFVSYTAMLTNNGPVDVDYADIQSGKYSIAVTNYTPSGSTLVVGTTSDDRVMFSGLQDISVGESIEITVVPGRDYENSYTGEMQHDNEMGHATDTQNGVFEVVMKLLAVNDDDSFRVLSESEPVTVTIDVWEDPSESMLKSCE